MDIEEFIKNGSSRQACPTNGDGLGSDTMMFGLIASKEMSAEEMMKYKRSHWGVETSLHYVLDETFLDNILRYTQSLDSLYIMAKFAGLTLPGYYSSEAKVAIINNSEFDVVLPEGFGIFAKDEATNERIYFYSLKQLELKAGKGASCPFIEGERVRIETVFGEFWNNDNFEFTIPTPVVGLNSVYVYAKYDFPGVPATKYLDEDHEFRFIPKVDDALLNLADEPCFSVYFAQSKVVVQLCPGMADFMQEDTPIVILYGIPYGVEANVGKVQARPLDEVKASGISIGSKLDITIQYASGASVPYGLEDARVFIGNNVWRPETLIVNADFDKLLYTEFPNVSRFTVNQEKGVEEMTVYVVPKEYDVDGTPMDAGDIYALCQDVYEYGKDLMFGGVKFKAVPAKAYEMDFVIEVILAINTSDTDDIRDSIIEILKSYLDRDTQERNMYVRRGKVITLLEDGIDAIYSVSLTYPVVDRRAADDEYYVLGNVVTNFIQNNEFEDWD